MSDIVSPASPDGAREQRASPHQDEQPFRLLFASNPQPMWVYDLETLAFLEVNDAAIDQYGYTREEFLSLRLSDIWSDVDEARLLEDVRRSQPSLHHAGEWQHRRKDGSLLDVAVTSHALEFAGRAAVLMGARDITAQKRAEHRTHEALSALLYMAEGLVLPSDDEDKAGGAGAAGGRVAEATRRVLECRHVAIVAIAPETEELHPVAVAGFAAEQEERWWRQWDARPRLSDRLEPAHIARLRADDVLILDRTQPPFPPDTSLGRRTVLMVPLRAGAGLTGILSVDQGTIEHHYTPDEIALVRAAGRLVGLVIERERLLRERAEAQANELALRTANRRMEEFLSLAGHELRTPLTSILGNVQLATLWMDELRQGLEDAGNATASGDANGTATARLARVQTLLRRMERQGRLLSQLVNDLLDTSCIQAGRLELRPEPCDLAALVRDIVQEHQQRLSWRTLHLDVPDAEVPVVCDAERITQVLVNYLSNALKFSAEDQPVTVTLELQQGVARVWVRDEGPGLPLSEHERVWERFYRVAGTGHRAGSSVGLGLGLHISRTIVERHGGHVGVESTPGTGAAFWFSLPRARPNAELADETGEQPGHSRQPAQLEISQSAQLEISQSAPAEIRT